MAARVTLVASASCAGVASVGYGCTIRRVQRPVVLHGELGVDERGRIDSAHPLEDVLHPDERALDLGREERVVLPVLSPSRHVVVDGDPGCDDGSCRT